MRHKVSLLNPAKSQAGTGQEIRDYPAAEGTIWARIEYLTGREAEIAQQISAESTHKITIRYNADVTPESRIQFGTRIFEIVAINNPEEKNEQQILTCKEIK